MPYENEKGIPRAKKDSHVVRPNYRGLGSVGWIDIPDAVIGAMVGVVTRAGGAIMLGVTSDGGALSICILTGSSKIKEYPRTEAEVASFLQWLKEDVFPTSISTKM